MRVITIISLCLFNLTTIVAQKTITGTVSDSFAPLQYATVSIKGTTKGVLTDHLGRFTIEVSKKDTLIFSYVGYDSETIKVKNKEDININLRDINLGEIVIVGYSKTLPKDHPTCLKTIEIASLSPQRIIGNTLDVNRIPIYPNPSSSGYFNIDLLEPYDMIDISVISITGQSILSRSFSQPNQNINIDLSRFATGIYIVNITSNKEKIATQKVIRS